MDNGTKQIIRNTLSNEINKLEKSCFIHKLEASYFYERAEKNTDSGDVCFKLLNHHRDSIRACKAKLKKIRNAIKLIKAMK